MVPHRLSTTLRMDPDGKKLRHMAMLSLLVCLMIGCRSATRPHANDLCAVALHPERLANTEVVVSGEYINADPHGEIVISDDCERGLTLAFSAPKPEGRDELIDADFGAILDSDPKRRVFARFTGVIRRGSGWYLDVRRVDQISIVRGSED